MKTLISKIVFIFFALLGQAQMGNAQAPAAIPYQAVARGASGNLIANQSISLRFTIHDVTAAGAVVYQETKSTTTNALGLFNVNIGQGTVVSGTFAGINWASGAKFTQVEIDVTGGTSYVDIGTQQMMSVPYALYAASSGTTGSNQWTTNGNDINNSNTGKVGIGTTTPEFKLSLDNDGGILAKGAFGSGANLTTNGAGTRMIWYPKKVAFRAGYVDGSQWDDVNIGLYSTALGVNTKASGNTSTAIGYSSTASGISSIAMGWNSFASGGYSTAMGNYTNTNSKYGAFSIGDESTVTYMQSSADNEFSARFDGGYRLFSDAATTTGNGLFFKSGQLGIGTSVPNAPLQFATSNQKRKIVLFETANNDNQFFGFGVYAGELGYHTGVNTDDHVFYTAASPTTSTELMRIKGNGNVGIGTNTPEFKLSLDNDGGIIAKGSLSSGATLTTAGAGTRMIWYPLKAAFRAGYVSGTQWDDSNIGGYSTAMGYNTKASGAMSTALGNFTTASNNSSTALGYVTAASGQYSTAMGYVTAASGQYSTAMGYGTAASGQYSTAIGYGTEASGDNSTSMGSLVNTNLKNGAFSIGDNSGSIAMQSSANNEFSARFDGGYRLFSDAATTTHNGFFFNGGKLGIGTSSPNASLQFETTNQKRKIVLFETANNDNQFFGFGVYAGELGYHTGVNSDDHVFYTAASPTTSTELMRIKGNGNVGIGTSAPLAKLDISGNIKIADGTQGAGKVLTSDANGLASWQNPSGGGSSEWTTSGNNIYNNNSGNVGIGTSTPNAPLQFSNVLSNRKIVLNEAANNDNQFEGFGINQGVLRYQVNTTSDDHVFYAGTSPTTSNELARIKGNGNLGIGTSNPQSKLHVYGADAYLWGLNLGFGTSNAIITTDAAKPIVFQQAGTEKMRMDVNGNVGIGTSSPNAPLQFSNVLSNRKIVLNEAANNDNQFEGFGINPGVLRYQVNTTGDDHVFFAGTSPTSSNELMRVKGNGNVGIGTSSPSAKLDVAGNVKIVDGTQSVGKVLTSDANGLASWNYPLQVASVTGLSGSAQLTLPTVGYTLPGMSCTITIPSGQNAKLLVSGGMRWFEDFSTCPLCADPTGEFYFDVDGVFISTNDIFFYPNSAYKNGVETYSNYVVDVGPGTHTINFWARKANSGLNHDLIINPIYATVLAIPH